VANGQLRLLREKLAAGFLVAQARLVPGGVEFVLPALEHDYSITVPESPALQRFMRSDEYRNGLMVFQTYGVAVLDLVGFSTHPDAVQLKMIVRYQCEVRKALHAKPVKALISIGDGTIFVFDASEIRRMPGYLFEIDHALAGFNLDFGLDGVPEITWRMGVHVGGAFLFNDINGQHNFVGSAINIARRVSKCVPKPGQQTSFEAASTIYVSEDAHEAFVAAGPPEGVEFTDAGVQTVKHEQEIHVFAMHKVTKP